MTPTKLATNRPGLNLHDHAVRADPFATYSKLREKFPVCQLDPDDLWAISRFDDVQYALKHPDVFSSEGFNIMIKPDWLNVNYTNGSLLTIDPPEHSRQRLLVNKAFVNRVINQLAPLMRSSATDLVRTMRKKPQIEFLGDLAYPYIGRIIGKIVGIGANYDEIRHWIDVVALVRPARPDDATVAMIEATVRKQNAYYQAVIEERRSLPQADLLSELIGVKIDGEALSDLEILRFLNLLVGAGFDTTINLLTNAMQALATRPQLTRQLVAEPQLIPLFIEEMLRFNPPTHSLMRLTTAPVTLSDVTIPQGAYVLLMVGAANRDPQKFDDPDTLDIHRNTKGHLAFGHGVHMCVGAALARMEVKIVLEEVLREVDEISCPAPLNLEWNTSLASRGVVNLPLEFTLSNINA